MKPTTLKTWVMVGITTLAALLSEGFPKTTIGWQIVGITFAGTMLVYIAKNVLWPSQSKPGDLDWRDVISGLIMAVGSALSNWGATAAVGEAINWGSLWTLVISVTVGYLVKTFAQQKPKE